MSLALAGGFFTTGPPGKSLVVVFVGLDIDHIGGHRLNACRNFMALLSRLRTIL